MTCRYGSYRRLYAKIEVDERMEPAPVRGLPKKSPNYLRPALFLCKLDSSIASYLYIDTLQVPGSHDFSFYSTSSCSPVDP